MPARVVSVRSRALRGSRPDRILWTSLPSPPSSAKSAVMVLGTISFSPMPSIRSAELLAVATEPSGPTVMTPAVIERRIESVYSWMLMSWTARSSSLL